MPTELGPHDLTSDTSHSPFVISASSAFGASPEWQAFDGLHGGYAQTWLGTGGGVDWLQIDMGSSQFLGSYAIVGDPASDSPPRQPKTWTMEGSPDGSTWTTLDTRASETGWTANEQRTYTCAAPGTYRYFRLNITANNGDATFTQVGELYLYQGVGSTPQTITFPAITDTLTLAATSDSGLTVLYTVTGPATLSGSSIVLTGAGTITVQATQPGNGTYAAATPVSQSWVAVDFAPHDLTSNTSHSPFVASASDEFHGAYYAFDGIGTFGWEANSSGTGSLQLDTGSGNSYLLYAYQVEAGGTSTQAPNTWTMQGSNDGTTWTTLDTQTGQTGWAGTQTRAFQIASPGSTSYRYFRLHVTVNNGDALLQVQQLYLYGIAGAPPVFPPNPQRGNIAYDQIKGTDRTGDGHQLLTWNITVPATSGAAGNAGQIAYDGTYLYLCVAGNTWLRATFVTW